MFDEESAGVYLGGEGDPVPVGTLQQWRTHNKGPAYIKVGRRVRYFKVDLDAFLAERRVDPSAAA